MSGNNCLNSEAHTPVPEYGLRSFSVKNQKHAGPKTETHVNNVDSTASKKLSRKTQLSYEVRSQSGYEVGSPFCYDVGTHADHSESSSDSWMSYRDKQGSNDATDESSYDEEFVSSGDSDTRSTASSQRDGSDTHCSPSHQSNVGDTHFSASHRSNTSNTHYCASSRSNVSDTHSCELPKSLGSDADSSTSATEDVQATSESEDHSCGASHLSSIIPYCIKLKGFNNEIHPATNSENNPLSKNSVRHTTVYETGNTTTCSHRGVTKLKCPRISNSNTISRGKNEMHSTKKKVEINSLTLAPLITTVPLFTAKNVVNKSENKTRRNASLKQEHPFADEDPFQTSVNKELLQFSSTTILNDNNPVHGNRFWSGNKIVSYAQRLEMNSVELKDDTKEFHAKSSLSLEEFEKSMSDSSSTFEPLGYDCQKSLSAQSHNNRTVKPINQPLTIINRVNQPPTVINLLVTEFSVFLRDGSHGVASHARPETFDVVQNENIDQKRDIQQEIEKRVATAVESLHLDLQGLELPFFPTAVMCAAVDRVQVSYRHGYDVCRSGSNTGQLQTRL